MCNGNRDLINEEKWNRIKNIDADNSFFDNYESILCKDKLRRSKEKAFRVLLNEYIVGFKPRQISERKSLYFDVTPQGKFIAVKKSGDKSFRCDLSASEQTLFDFLCFIEINKFRQIVNSVKDFNYKEKPLILVNFPDFLDESFDYISFLRKQKLNRKIIIVSDISVPKTSH